MTTDMFRLSQHFSSIWSDTIFLEASVRISLTRGLLQSKHIHYVDSYKAIGKIIFQSHALEHWTLLVDRVLKSTESKEATEPRVPSC
jgi:hypothetical protein